MSNNQQLAKIARIFLYLFVVCLANACSFRQVADPVDRTSTTKCWYFAIQTMTTTGYGSGVIFSEDVMRVACFFMVVGGIMWALALAVTIGLVLPPKS